MEPSQLTSFELVIQPQPGHPRRTLDGSQLLVPDLIEKEICAISNSICCNNLGLARTLMSDVSSNISRSFVKPVEVTLLGECPSSLGKWASCKGPKAQIQILYLPRALVQTDTLPPQYKGPMGSIRGISLSLEHYSLPHISCTFGSLFLSIFTAWRSHRPNNLTSTACLDRE